MVHWCKQLDPFTCLRPSVAVLTAFSSGRPTGSDGLSARIAGERLRAKNEVHFCVAFFVVTRWWTHRVRTGITPQTGGALPSAHPSWREGAGDHKGSPG